MSKDLMSKPQIITYILFVVIAYFGFKLSLVAVLATLLISFPITLSIKNHMRINKIEDTLENIIQRSPTLRRRQE